MADNTPGPVGPDQPITPPTVSGQTVVDGPVTTITGGAGDAGFTNLHPLPAQSLLPTDNTTPPAQTADQFYNLINNYQGPSYAQMLAGQWGEITPPQPPALNIPNAAMPVGQAVAMLEGLAANWNAEYPGQPNAALYSTLADAVSQNASNPNGTYYLNGSTATQIFQSLPTDQATSFINQVTNNSASNAESVLQAELDQYGLGGLANWAWNQVLNGASSDQILFNLRQTPEYQARFPGMAIRQQNGLPAMSESDYINFETQAIQLMRQAGLPNGYFDNPEAIGQLVGNDVSITELNDRITNGYAEAIMAPPQVQNAFSQWYGAKGPAMLASHFLNPQNSLPMLQRELTSAQIAGQGALAGFGVGEAEAQQAAGMGVTQAQASSAFQTLAKQIGLFTPNVGEAASGTGATGEQGVQAALGLNPGAQSALELAQAARANEFGAGGGGAQQTKEGYIGTGVARPL
jgi:hypothetical protein